MCEARIEKAAKSVEGVSKADWNKDTKMMEVTFDDAKTNVDKVETAIAKVGHDTDTTKQLMKCTIAFRVAANTIVLLKNQKNRNHARRAYELI